MQCVTLSALDSFHDSDFSMSIDTGKKFIDITIRQGDTPPGPVGSLGDQIVQAIRHTVNSDFSSYGRILWYASIGLCSFMIGPRLVSWIVDPYEF